MTDYRLHLSFQTKHKNLIAGAIGLIALTGCSKLVDMSKPGSTSGMLAANSRVQAWVEDNIALQPNFQGITKARGGPGISENGVFAIETVKQSPAEAAQLAKRFGMSEVTDRKDPDASDTSTSLQQYAAKFRNGDASVKFYKVKGNPESLKLKTGRRFEHALYFYDSQQGEGILQLGYTDFKGVHEAEAALDKIMTPKAPPSQLLQRAEAGDARAQYELAKFYQKNNPFNRGIPLSSVKWYQKAAEQNNVEAQYELGCIKSGTLPVHDVEGAELWLTKAANAGHRDAPARLAMLYSYGGTASGAKKARPWLKKAAANGSPEGMYHLAISLGDTPAERKEAIALLQKIVENNNDHWKQTAAISLVDALSRDGQKQEAMRYLRMAADEGDSQSQVRLGDLMAAEGNFKDAARYFKLVCDHTPAYNTSLLPGGTTAGTNEYNRAVESEKSGDIKQAAILYRTCYTLRAQAAASQF